MFLLFPSYVPLLGFQSLCFSHLFLLAGNNFGQPFYSRWMQEFACLMNGNWYSTQAVSQCKGEPDESCWWKLNSPVRGEVVVNGESSNA